MLKKIGLTLLIILVVLGAIAYLYLFVDHPYPEFKTEGLSRFESGSISPGKVFINADSASLNIRIDGEWFKDQTGRTMNLRGINVSGDSKLPFAPRIPSHVKDGFFESSKTVSFVGRPFPLEEADLHFKRLKGWGFQFVRLLVTWEAIEHEGPGIYDRDYLQYIYEIATKAQQYDINILVDPHQDMWSRFTGGDGAPGWTLEVVGLDATKLLQSGAAIVHNIQGDPFPKTIWTTNDSKLGASTMFTLFYGGNDFASQLNVNGIPIQNYLQDHYINAVLEVAKTLKGLKNVVGFDTLNEPLKGYIGLNNLDSLALLRIGAMPTFFQGMAAGDGNPEEVGFWQLDLGGFKEIRKEWINRERVKVWSRGDVWQQHGVWGYSKGNPVILKKNYFSDVSGRRVDFSEDYLKPFLSKFAKAIRAIDSRWIIFSEPALFTKLPRFSENESNNMVNAGHWYDGVTLVTLKYFSWLNADEEKLTVIYGKKKVREHFDEIMRGIKQQTIKSLGDRPTLIGEIGIPFDLNMKEAYVSDDFSDQSAAMDRSINAMESSMLNYTLWNYSADNDNTHGDQWNGEDFSVFSLTQQRDKSDINSGGRALQAVIRPYPYKVSGIPIQFFFNKDKGEFILKFRNDTSIKLPTEIFLPSFHFGKGYDVWITRGRLEQDPANNLLLYYPEGEGEHTIVVRKSKVL